MSNILITGANGFLGKYLMEQLLRDIKYKVFTLSRSKEKLKNIYANQNCVHFDIVDFEHNNIPFEKIDVVIHCAFGRAQKGATEITSSLEFTNQLFNKIVQHNSIALINISTQEIYGSSYREAWKESLDPMPSTLYGMAKFASEMFTKTLLSLNIIATNIRLPGLLGKETESRMVNKFVQNAVSGKEIAITGGNQIFSQLDVRDAVDGIIALLKLTSRNWKPIYNLGYLKSYTILEIANTVATVAEKYHYPEVRINLNKTDDTFYAELDSSLFFSDTNWQPKYDMEKIVNSIFKYKINKN